MGRPPGGSDRARHSTCPPPLVGRQRELQRVRSAVDGLDSGAGSTVLVEGEPGIGTSRLLRHVVHGAAERGYATFSGRGEELERNRPLHAFTDLLDRCPGPGGSATSEDRLVDAVVDRVAEMASHSPLVLVVDDLNWCDRASLRVAGALARRAGTERVLVLAGVRPLPSSRSLDRVCELLGSGGQYVPLGPLPSPEVEELAATLLDARPGPTLREVLGKAGGNPFYVTQLIRALGEDGALHLVDGRAECACTGLPTSLRRVVLQRLTVLPDPVLVLLRLAAVLVDPFTITDLEALTGADALALAGPLAGAARAGFLTARRPPDPAAEACDRLSFRHALIREVLCTDLPSAVRAVLLRRAGEALTTDGAPPPRTAQHPALGARRGGHCPSPAVTGPRSGSPAPSIPTSAAVTTPEPALRGTLQQAPGCSDQRTRPLPSAATVESTADDPVSPSGAALTASERTVVALVAEGLTNRQIGDRLFISRRTVETHLAHTFDKLGVRNRAGVAALAARHGLDAGPAPGPAAAR